MEQDLPTQLVNKVVCITGASSGIGEACADAFAKAGAAILLCARRLEKLESLAQHLRTRYGVAVYIFPCDVSHQAQVATAFQNLPADWQDIDVLINNAGLAAGREKAQTANIEDWNTMVDTNLKGLMYVTHEVLDSMVTRQAGHIINLASIAGHEVYSGGSVYCATKSAVLAFSQGLKMDLLGTPIRVTCISPGLVSTDFSVVRFRGDTEKAQAVYQGMIPLTAKDVAAAVLYTAMQPQHVNISEIVLMPTDQSSVNLVHRRETPTTMVRW